MMAIALFIVLVLGLMCGIPCIAGAMHASEEGPTQIPNIEMLNRRRRRKDWIRQLRISLACRLGCHDWVTRERIRGTTSVWGLFRGVQSGVPVEGLKQQCRHCLACREVVDAGFHSETVPVGTL